MLKVYKILAKKVQRVVSHDTEDYGKILRKTDLLFQKWQEFGKFWSDHSKVSKVYTLIGQFREKYVMFDLKKYREIIFHDTREWWKIGRKADLQFGK